MRVLVTGGKGFIGTAVCEALARRGHTPILFDRPLDVRSVADLNVVGAGVDAVIHLAGMLGTHELFDEVHKAVDVNIHGTVNVLDLCKRNNARYVGITMPQVFPSIYTATKVAATRLASAYAHSEGVHVSHVRAFNAFGPGQAHGPGHPQKIVPTFAVEAWAGRPLPIWGDGTQGVDLIYTPDLARLLVDCLTIQSNDVIVDGGTRRMFTVNEVAEMVQAIVHNGGGPPPAGLLHLPMRRGETPTQIVAKGDGWDELGWSASRWMAPRFDLSDLDTTVNAYRDHPLAHPDVLVPPPPFDNPSKSVSLGDWLAHSRQGQS